MRSWAPPVKLEEYLKKRTKADLVYIHEREIAEAYAAGWTDGQEDVFSRAAAIVDSKKDELSAEPQQKKGFEFL